MRILFVGDGWLGSNSRSLKEAFARRGDVVLHEVDTDSRAPLPKGVTGRILARLRGPLERARLEDEVNRAVRLFAPDVTVFYKGHQFSFSFLLRLSRCTRVVNCFPDYSPHAYGPRMKRAMGAYDLVISTKHYHPANWSAIYGYANNCVFVPHGYDPTLHLRSSYSNHHVYDAVIVGTGRDEYHDLVEQLAESLSEKRLRVAIGGNGWKNFKAKLPPGWEVLGPRFGPEYTDLLRQGAIAIAPVQRKVCIAGIVQPGDEDTARSYELAAAHCFFLHQRTEFVTELYDEAVEVPLFQSPAELADKILFYLDQEDLRQRMAAAAHARAVPRYSIDQRAEQMMGHLQELVARRLP